MSDQRISEAIAAMDKLREVPSEALEGFIALDESFPFDGYRYPDPRSAPRVPTNLLVTFAQLRFNDELLEPRMWLGRTIDVSESGLRIETDKALTPGDRVQIDIAHGSRVLSSTATVIHQGESTAGLHSVGLELTTMTSADRAFLRNVAA